MSDSSRCGGQLDTAAGIRPFLAIGIVFAVVMFTVAMCAVVTFAVIAILGYNAAHRGHVAAVDKVLAVAGKGVGDRDQCPDNDQNPSYSRRGGFGHIVSDSRRCFFGTMRLFARDDLSIECQP